MKQTKPFLFLVFFLFSICCLGQSPSWVFTSGSQQGDEGLDITQDAQGNIYSCGRFSGTVDFDNGPGVFNLTSNGSMDMFVTKYSGNGQFIWAISMGGTGRDGANSIRINNADEVIVTGYIRNTVDMDPGPGVFNLVGVSTNGTDPGFGGDVFLAKYSNGGSLIWAFSVQNEYWQNAGWGLEIDNMDNIYVAVQNNATSSIPSDFDPGPGVSILTGAQHGHAVLVKYTTNSNYIWGFSLGGWGANSSLTGVQLVPNDTTLIITGHVRGSNFDVNPGAGINLMSTQLEDVFVGKYSINQNYLWAFNCGSSGLDAGRQNAVDSVGNFYMTGLFSNTVDFDPSPSVANLVSSGNFDIFIAKYDVSGNYKWAKSFGAAAVDVSWGIDYNSGKIINVGHFSGTVDFDPGPAVFNLISAGNKDAFFSNYDTAGNFICAARIGGTLDEDLWCIDYLPNDTILINGFYGSNNIDVDPTAGTLIRTNAGGNDILFGKYYYQSVAVNVTATATNDTVCVGQNPTISVDFNPTVTGNNTAVITDGINNYAVNNISDNIPFSFNATPTVQTTYTITITGSIASNCALSPYTVSVPFTVYVNPDPNITATANPLTLCAGLSTTLTGAGGTSYVWTGGVVNGVAFIPPTTTSYTVTGTDINGCTNTSSVTVTVVPAPSVTASANPASVCQGVPTVLTGNGALTYTWSGGVVNGVPFLPNGNTVYTVTGTDANGCTATSTITVNVTSGLAVNITPANPLLCIGDSVQLLASGAVSYIWDNVLGLSSYTDAAVWANPVVATTYTVTGTDGNGCTGTSTVFITVTTEIDVTVSKSGDAECNNHIIQLQAGGANNYSWTPANLLTNPNDAVTSATVYETTTFYVTGTNGSCVATDSIIVYNYNNDETGIFIPNAFSPNGDNLNDCLRVVENANFKKYYFAIYNRWGQLVFETDNSKLCWDGNLNGKVCDVGTYFYYLRAETACGKIFKKGDVNLIR